MSTPYLSEVKMFSFNFAPRGWAQCNGQLLPINQNQALFSLLGTTYGGNGVQNFALPNLQSRTFLHLGQSPGGSNYFEGQTGGEENHTLLLSEIPQHTHPMQASGNTADVASPGGNLLATGGTEALFAASQNGSAMANNMVSTTGGSQPHSNIQPYLTLNFCIALQGIFPSRN